MFVILECNEAFKNKSHGKKYVQCCFRLMSVFKRNCKCSTNLGTS